MAAQKKESTLATHSCIRSFDSNNSVLEIGVATSFSDSSLYMKFTPVYSEFIGEEVAQGQRRYDYDNGLFGMFSNISNVALVREFFVKFKELVESGETEFDDISVTMGNNVSLIVYSRSGIADEDQELYNSPYLLILSKGEAGEEEEVVHCFGAPDGEISSDPEYDTTLTIINWIINVIDNVATGTGAVLAQGITLKYKIDHLELEKPAPSSNRSSRSSVRGGRKKTTSRRSARVENADNEELGTDEDIPHDTEETTPKRGSRSSGKREAPKMSRRNRAATNEGTDDVDDAAEEAYNEI